MTRKEAITLSMQLEDKIALERQAEEYGFFYGGKPNVSAYIRAIARGKVDPSKQVRDAISLIQEGVNKLGAE